jgi:intracellular sulfur oxidation DsrE/DsrF family protein
MFRLPDFSLPFFARPALFRPAIFEPVFLGAALAFARRGAQFLLAGVLASQVFAAAALAETPRFKLLIQVSEDSTDKLALAVNHAKHVQDTLGRENVAIELVAWGPGVKTLRYYTPLDDELKEMHHRGVRIVACEKSLYAAKLKRTDLIRSFNLATVPSGLAEITVRQSEGWAYAAP